MRKLNTFLIILLSIILALSWSIPVSAASGNPGKAGSLTFTIDAGQYTVIQDEDGLDIIQMEGFYSSTSYGDPILPYKVLDILLPPDVVWPSVRYQVVDMQTEILQGTYNIKPAPPILALPIMFLRQSMLLKRKTRKSSKAGIPGYIMPMLISRKIIL